MISSKAIMGFRETVRSPLWLYMLGGLMAGAGFGVTSGLALVEILDRNPLEAPQSVIIYAAGIVFALLGLAIWNRAQLDITVTDGGVELQMGILRRRIPWTQIDGVSTSSEFKWPKLLSAGFLTSLVWPTTVWKQPKVNTGVRLVVKSGGEPQTLYVCTHRRHELTTILKRNLSI